VGEETSKPIGLVIVEDMIARAEAACEKVRAKLTTSPSANSLIDGRRRAKLHAMEDTLAKAIAKIEHNNATILVDTVIVLIHAQRWPTNADISQIGSSATRNPEPCSAAGPPSIGMRL
jgi:hypothetical protein